jgi:hypothetical protein
MGTQIFDYTLSEAGLAAAEGSLRGDICSRTYVLPLAAA